MTVVNILSNFDVETGNSTVPRKILCNGVFETKQALCPLVIPMYNYYMGGVDLSDQLRKSYGIDRKSRRWYIRPFHHFFDICAVNSYVLYLCKCKENHLSVITELEFRSKLVKELVGKFSCCKKPGPNPPSSCQGHENVNTVNKNIKKRGRCVYCSKRENKRNNT